MKTSDTTSTRFFELVNNYPSPHNGQPIVLRRIGDDGFELYFQKERGLQSSDISYIFSFVSMGVFVEHMKKCAEALGHSLRFSPTLPKIDELSGSGAIKFGKCQINWSASQPDEMLEKVLRERKTSRKKYTAGVPHQLSRALQNIASSDAMSLKQLPSAQAKQAIWLNQRAVFDDMFDEPVRQELDHWLRYTATQKQTTKDGLAYDCMELNGRLLKYVVAHPGVLRLPGMSWFLRHYYLRTMTDASSVFYLLAPFETGDQSFRVGRTIMRLWLACAQAGYYIHPFGTIVSNQQAHHDFLQLVGIDEESREKSYLVFIFRAGKSDPPVSSLRLSVKEHLLQE